jgi:seryl-tRNA synthetase
MPQDLLRPSFARDETSMLDIRFIRENPDLIRQNLKRRRNDEKLKMFERLLELDEKVRALGREIQDFRTQRNRLSKEIGQLKKSGEDDSKLVEKANKVNAKISKAEDLRDELQGDLRLIQMSIPNMLHESVPYGKDEDDNEVTKEWGGQPEFDFEVQSSKGSESSRFKILLSEE